MSQDVAGFCPMGCGQTLSLMAEGHVTCRKAGCPQPDAASRILHDPEAGHIVVLGEEAFTVLHPLRERLDDALMDCGLHADLERWGPPLPPGRWRVPIGGTADRAWDWERVND